MKKRYLKVLLIGIVLLGALNNQVLADNDILQKVATDKEQLIAAIPEKATVQETSCAEEDFDAKAHAFGDMGFRSDLAKHGIYPEVNYTSDMFRKLRGMDKKHNKTSSLGLVDFSITLDTEKMGLIPGGLIYVLGQNIHTYEFNSALIGDLQGVSSIDAPVGTILGEYWYQQKLFKDKLRIKVGKQDANCDFDSLETSGDFMNSSFTLMPTIPMPSYPYQALGVAGFIEPNNLFKLKAGFYDGASQPSTLGFRTAFGGKSEFFSIVEAAFTPTIKNLSGNYIVGYWHNSGYTSDVVDPDRIFSSNNGFYTAFEQALFREKDNSQGFAVQAQYGWSPYNRNEISSYYGVSCTYTGLFPARDSDVFGLGTGIAVISKKLKAEENLKNETVLETFYKIQLRPWLAIQPDLQYVFNPGGNNKNGFIAGFRLMFSL